MQYGSDHPRGIRLHPSLTLPCEQWSSEYHYTENKCFHFRVLFLIHDHILLNERYQPTNQSINLAKKLILKKDAILIGYLVNVNMTQQPPLTSVTVSALIRPVLRER